MEEDIAYSGKSSAAPANVPDGIMDKIRKALKLGLHPAGQENEKRHAMQRATRLMQQYGIEQTGVLIVMVVRKYCCSWTCMLAYCQREATLQHLLHAADQRCQSTHHVLQLSSMLRNHESSHRWSQLAVKFEF